MLTAKYVPSAKRPCTDARLSIQASMSGGSNDTEANALTVIPTGRWSSPLVVTTVTPLTKRPSAARNSSLLTGITTWVRSVASGELAPKVRRRTNSQPMASCTYRPVAAFHQSSQRDDTRNSSSGPRASDRGVADTLAFLPTIRRHEHTCLLRHPFSHTPA